MHIQLKMTTQITLENLFLGTGAGEIDGGGSMLFSLEMLLSLTAHNYKRTLKDLIRYCQCESH